MGPRRQTAQHKPSGTELLVTITYCCPFVFLRQVGSNGVLSIESSNSTETFVEVQEGMEIDRGYISPQFVTNNERLLAEYDNCRVLITDQKIESIRDIVPILEQVRRDGKGMSM